MKVGHALPATGPYKVASHDPKRGVRLVRNPRFREWSQAAQPSGYPNEIALTFGGGADAQVSAVEHGRADLTADAGAASAATVSALQTQYASHLEVNPKAALLSFFLNTRVAPFDDVRVRRAVSFAVDRNELVALSRGGASGQTTCQLLPPNFDGYRRYCPYTLHPNSGGAWTAPDLAKARELVAASGTRGQLVTVLSTPAFAKLDALLRLGAREPRLQDAHQGFQGGPRELLPVRLRFTAQGSGWNRRVDRRLRLGVGLVRPAAHLRVLRTALEPQHEHLAGFATRASMRRSPAPACSRRAIRRPRRSSGARSTATWSIRLRRSPL